MLVYCVGVHSVTYGGDPEAPQFERVTFTDRAHKDNRYVWIEPAGLYHTGRFYRISISEVTAQPRVTRVQIEQNGVKRWAKVVQAKSPETKAEYIAEKNK